MGCTATRGIVSKQKIRFTADGFDLDLTYITTRVIAMGWPSEGIEAVFRNRMSDVQRFFERYHEGHIRVYNLCSERVYSPDSFGPGNVERHPFADHNPCPLSMIKPFCTSVQRFLDANPSNVVAVHCKAGKGRTGMLISAYILDSGMRLLADEALRYFGRKRTSNGKGVTIPSQKRYVKYYEEMLTRQLDDITCAPAFRIDRIRMPVVPNFDPMGGCDPYFKVYQYSQDSDRHVLRQIIDSRVFRQLIDSRATNVAAHPPTPRGLPMSPLALLHGSLTHLACGDSFDLDISGIDVVIQGDTKIVFFDTDYVSTNDKMCCFWFHTAFIGSGTLVLQKSEIDQACSWKGDSPSSRFPAGFKIEVNFSPAESSLRDAQAASDPDIEVAQKEVVEPDMQDQRIRTAYWWCKRISRLYDSAEDGLIELSEVFFILSEAGCNLNKNDKEQLRTMDTEGDGSICFEDFVAILRAKLNIPTRNLADEKVFELFQLYNKLLAHFALVDSQTPKSHSNIPDISTAIPTDDVVAIEVGPLERVSL